MKREKRKVWKEKEEQKDTLWSLKSASNTKLHLPKEDARTKNKNKNYTEGRKEARK